MHKNRQTTFSGLEGSKSDISTDNSDSQTLSKMPFPMYEEQFLSLILYVYILGESLILYALGESIKVRKIIYYYRLLEGPFQTFGLHF